MARRCGLISSQPRNRLAARRRHGRRMGLDTKHSLDRRRVRRQLSFWRVLAVIALTLAAGALLVSSESGLLDRRQIARVSLEGMIPESRDLLKLLDRDRKSVV